MAIRPAGFGGQVKYQAALGQFGEFGGAEHPGRYGVDDQIKTGEMPSQKTGVERAVPGGFNACKVAW